MLLAAPAFIVSKKKMLPENAALTLTVFLLYVCQPFLIIRNFQLIDFSGKILLNMLYSAILALVSIILILIISRLAFKRFANADKLGVLNFTTAFGNCGFLGIPLVMGIFGAETMLVIYCTIYVVMFNILSYTVGVYMITGDKKYIKAKKIFLNPPFVAVVIALPLFFLNIKFTDFSPELFKGISFLADMLTPLSMFILGIRLSKIRFVELVNDLNIYAASFIKLIIMPLLILLIMLPFKLDEGVKYAMFFMCAVPSGATAMAFCEQFDRRADIAAKCVLLSTIFSVLTIPLMTLML